MERFDVIQLYASRIHLLWITSTLVIVTRTDLIDNRQLKWEGNIIPREQNFEILF